MIKNFNKTAGILLLCLQVSLLNAMVVPPEITKSYRDWLKGGNKGTMWNFVQQQMQGSLVDQDKQKLDQELEKTKTELASAKTALESARTLLGQRETTFATKTGEYENLVKTSQANVLRLQADLAQNRVAFDFQKQTLLGQLNDNIDQRNNLIEQQKLALAQKDKEVFAQIQKTKTDYENIQKEQARLSEELKKQQEVLGKEKTDKKNLEVNLQQKQVEIDRQKSEIEEQRALVKKQQEGFPPKIQELQSQINKQKDVLDEKIKSLSGKLTQLELDLNKEKQLRESLEREKQSLTTRAAAEKIKLEEQLEQVSAAKERDAKLLEQKSSLLTEQNKLIEAQKQDFAKLGDLANKLGEELKRVNAERDRVFADYKKLALDLQVLMGQQKEKGPEEPLISKDYKQKLEQEESKKKVLEKEQNEAAAKIKLVGFWQQLDDDLLRLGQDNVEAFKQLCNQFGEPLDKLLDKQDLDKRNVFHHIAGGGNASKILAYLIEQAKMQKIDLEKYLNSQDKEGNTPLNIVLGNTKQNRNIRLEMARMLLKNGASANIVNKQKETAIGIAERLGFKEKDLPELFEQL